MLFSHEPLTRKARPVLNIVLAIAILALLGADIAVWFSVRYLR